jgi:hypothetical protein
MGKSSVIPRGTKFACRYAFRKSLRVPYAFLMRNEYRRASDPNRSAQILLASVRLNEPVGVGCRGCALAGYSLRACHTR